MARPYRELRDKMTPKARERARQKAEREMLRMDLAEIRKRISALTQAEVSSILETTQGAISQLEKREDALLSTLSEYIKALGGELELVAHFPDSPPVRITQFEGVKEQLEKAAG